MSSTAPTGCPIRALESTVTVSGAGLLDRLAAGDVAGDDAGGVTGGVAPPVALLTSQPARPATIDAAPIASATLRRGQARSTRWRADGKSSASVACHGGGASPGVPGSSSAIVSAGPARWLGT